MLAAQPRGHQKPNGQQDCGDPEHREDQRKITGRQKRRSVTYQSSGGAFASAEGALGFASDNRPERQRKHEEGDS